MTDRTPPHNLEMERALLCSCLIDPNAFALVQRMTAGMFYDPKYGKLFKVMSTLFHQGEPIDAVTICDNFDDQGMVVSLSNEVATAAHVEHYRDQVIKCAERRRIIQIGQQTTEKGYSDADVSDMTSTAIDDLSKVKSFSGDKVINLQDASYKSLEVISERVANFNNPDKIEFPNTNMGIVNRMLGGGYPPGLHFIASAPSVGKSDMINNLAEWMSKRWKVGFFQMESSMIDQLIRMWSLETGYNRLDIKAGDLSNTQLKYMHSKVLMGNRNIIFDFKSGQTLQEIKAKVYTWKAKHGIDVVFIDNLQYIVIPRIEELKRIETCERFLHPMGLELGIPIILAHHLTKYEGAPRRKPVLDNMRYGGDKAAASVLMLWRSHYQSNESHESDILELLWRKIRDGKTGVVRCAYDLTTGVIRQLEDQSYKQEDEPEDRPF